MEAIRIAGDHHTLGGPPCKVVALESYGSMYRCTIMLAITALSLIGCGDATNTVQGGDPLFKAGGSAVIPEGGSSVTSADCQPGGTHGGDRWQDLYACFFGPSGGASCGLQGASCHGTSTSTGVAASGGFVCGQTQDACWMGMTSTIVPAGSASAPKSTRLYGALRKPDGTGLMPLNSSFVFQANDLSRIASWIQAGAQND
jgi:hypothetical protein